jgi:chromosome condensin MukBEF ATPase and DNA-binding subunit MukB
VRDVDDEGGGGVSWTWTLTHQASTIHAATTTTRHRKLNGKLDAGVVTQLQDLVNSDV